MIIYGYRNREIEKGMGNFYCPKCETQRPYKHKKTVRYFTLFFIPLFPLGTLSEYVECTVCGRTYKPEILSISSSQGGTSFLESIENSTSQSSLQNPDVSPPATKPKGNTCLPWVLILVGLVLLFGAGLMGIALVATQYDGSIDSSIASFILAVIICPLPLALLGTIAMGGGIYLLRTRPETDTT